MIRPHLVLLIVLAAPTARAESDAPPAGVRAHAVRRSTPIAIDGQLGEAAWASAPRQTGFVQRFPRDGARADHETKFAVLYDDDAIYVGVWASDPEPDRIRRLLTRRDVDAPADTVAVGFDSYLDRRTAYVFQLNAAGVQRDMLIFDDANTDDTWDAVWTGSAAVDDRGWTAEFRIPLNQLRFSSSDTQQWGLQVWRTVGRTQEQSTWSPWPRSGPAVVSKFGIVDGIDHLRPTRRLELLPYALGGVDVQPVAAGDPVNQHTVARRNLGLDVKYGLGPAFTVSATINPDFGQVEADPSQVNLGPNELFFTEKRPFFLEGVDLFKLPIGNGDNSPEGPFYSRRIGAAAPDPAGDVQFLAKPSSTAIYGAAKLTGKTASGWSIGALDAVTGEETAEVVDSAGVRTTPIVAPLTNFAVAHVKRDFRDGQTAVGAFATAVDREVGDTPLATTLHDQAYTGGAQIQHRWDDSAWELNFHTLGSWVHGSEQAIAATQTANHHLFQRPDAEDVHFDPHRTSLSGLGATWVVGRTGNTQHWRFGTGGDLRTPGLELNDAGYQTTSDRVNPFVWGTYRDVEPGEHVLNWQINSDIFSISNFEPRLLADGLENSAGVQLANYWQLGAGANLVRNHWDPVALRGGPALRVDPSVQGYLEVTTDTRKPVWFDVLVDGNHTGTTGATTWDLAINATIQARPDIDLALGPAWTERNDPLQYVDQPIDATGARHYLLARIRQRVASLVLRLNWTFSPHLSLQAYAQPFAAAGQYSDYKDVDNPHADRYRDRFYLLQPTDITESDGMFSVTHAGSYRFTRPDFDVRQLRSTVVLRWEYLPGSSVFVIWNQSRSSSLDDGAFHLGRDLGDLTGTRAENLVMVKVNYWIGL